MWIIVLTLTIASIVLCATIGICCYLALRTNQPKQKEMRDSPKKEHIPDGNANVLSGETNKIKSHSAVSCL